MHCRQCSCQSFLCSCHCLWCCNLQRNITIESWIFQLYFSLRSLSMFWNFYAVRKTVKQSMIIFLRYLLKSWMIGYGFHVYFTCRYYFPFCFYFLHDKLRLKPSMMCSHFISISVVIQHDRKWNSPLTQVITFTILKI